MGFRPPAWTKYGLAVVLMLILVWLLIYSGTLVAHHTRNFPRAQHREHFAAQFVNFTRSVKATLLQANQSVPKVILNASAVLEMSKSTENMAKSAHHVRKIINVSAALEAQKKQKRQGVGGDDAYNGNTGNGAAGRES